MERGSTFHAVTEKPKFPEEEEKIIKLWEELDAFKKSVQMSQGKTRYTFYDGPPFATGLPHYGHIAAGTIKDVVTRYWHQNGYHVERRFGWDCHGLPIEFEIDKSEGIRTKQDVLKIGIPEYNKKCRAIVMRYSEQWRQIVTRLGRWIDFDDDYKTMDLSFMESVWWVFKQLFDKGLVYRSSRVMPYSCGCNTVLSNFEANLNYNDVKDPSVVVSFPVLGAEFSILAWTTTPWTLPSNLALAVNPNLDYIKFKPKGKDQVFLVCEALLPGILKDMKVKEYETIGKLKGEALVGLEYEPLFSYWVHMKESGCFKVYSGEFVTSESGTGIVHCAPYGEEDFNLFMKNGLVRPENPPDSLDENGHFTSVCPEIQGLQFKEANEPIKRMLKEKGRLIYSGVHNHSYPFCWRSDTPLIYRPVKSWFIRVEAIKDRLIKNNLESRWVPSFVQERRFHNWLEDARDWCFSRNRFWGNPIPLWVSDDQEEVVCVGSVEELRELTGEHNITDLHRESIDNLEIPSKQGKGTLKRIEEVFDCWFESGSMPYAQCHYPFDVSEEEFRERFPADFIAEGLDQTRGWFYTLMVLGTGTFDQPPFRNLIVNGLVLAADGAKMSKSKGNYTDPMLIVNNMGADAIRLYLVSSPLVRAEPLKFMDDGVWQTVREIFLPWYNAYRFFIQNASRYEAKSSQKYVYDEQSIHNATNFMDIWIVAACQNLIKYVRNEMEHYRLYTVVPALLKFLNNLTNWYVRLNRKRIKGETPLEDTKIALDTLMHTLLNVTVLMSPFTPFITENIYQNLRLGLPEESEDRQESIHFVMIPQFKAELINEGIEKSVSRMQVIIDLARKVRDKKKIVLKTPVSRIKVIHRDEEYLESLTPVITYMKEELNAAEVVLEKETPENVLLTAVPNSKVLGKRLGKTFNKNFIQEIKSLSHEAISEYKETGRLGVKGVEVLEEELQIQRKYKAEDPDLEGADDSDVIVVVDCKLNPELIQEGQARRLATAVQKLRKTAGLHPDDQVVVFYHPPGEYYSALLQNQMGLLERTLKVPILPLEQKDSHPKFIAEGSEKHDNEELVFSLHWKEQ